VSATTNAVTFDIPAQLDRRISPNGRAHWRTKHKLQQTLKETAYYAAYNANLEMWQSMPPLTLHYTIFHGKGRKRLDEDNCIAALKPVQDAIAQVIGVDDRFFHIGTIEQHRDPDGAGFIRVRIEDNQ